MRKKSESVHKLEQFDEGQLMELNLKIDCFFLPVCSHSNGSYAFAKHALFSEIEAITRRFITAFDAILVE